MKISRVLAVLCAATLAPVALTAPAAHADQSWSGQITTADPKASFAVPNRDTDRCDGGPGMSYAINYDTVSFQSTTEGPRTFAVTGDRVLMLIVKVNGVCVAGDWESDNGDGDYDAQRVDVTGVQIAKGDLVEVQIIDDAPRAWSLTVSQPGSWNGPATGAATTYVALPEQVSCATGTATATLTKKAAKAARKGKVRSILVTANGQRVAKVKGSKLRKAARKGIALNGIPKGAVTLDVVVKVRGGKKRMATRAYSAC